MPKRARYEVLTWDSDKDGFTPQAGVRRGPYSLFGLRKAIRKLQDLGYPADRGDPSVLVQRVGGALDWFPPAAHRWGPGRKQWLPTLGWPCRRRSEQRQEAGIL